MALIRGITVKLDQPIISTDVFRQETLCASVSLQNGSSSQLSYESEDWSIQSPTGDVQPPSLLDSSEDLGDGQLSLEEVPRASCISTTRIWQASTS